MAKISFLAAKRLLFIGDSITDCGRLDPDGRPLGKGYVQWLRHLLMLRQPEQAIEFVNRGIGGNTAEDLWSRWEEDVIAERPDALSVMIGINDCNRYLCNRDGNPRQSPEAYERYLRDGLRSTRERLGDIPILLAAPFFLGCSRDATQYRGQVVALLPEYTHRMRAVAEATGAEFLDTAEAFAGILRHHPPSVLSHDMVHLNETGVLALAELFYQKLFAGTEEREL